MEQMVVSQEKSQHAKGKVVKAFGNLLQVEFEGNIRQGEVAFVHLEGIQLKAEVIEITGNEAKIQVFEDTKGIQLGSPVSFVGDLLEAELGPGLLSSIFDGLQNPLVEIADVSGFFLPRGLYLAPLDRHRHWDFDPVAKVGDELRRGDTIGITLEGRFHHRIMIPFSHYGTYQLTWVIAAGSYTIETVVARAVDENGQEHAFTMVQKWPVKNALVQGEKIKPTKMMDTGERIIDTQLPLVKGGTFCTPGPFGAGKTVLQHHLSKYASVDIVVFVACGERAGEVVEVLREFPHLIDPHTGESLMRRTVMICNTSSMPVAARESSIYMGITIAEYYRQMGLDVLVLADSTSRWAQALREMSGRLEEIPGEEAFPAYLASRIAEFYERSGARSDSRRYPAVDPLISWSKYIDTVSQELSHQVEGWDEMVKKARWILLKGNDIGKRMEVVGEEGVSLEDLIIYLKAELYDFSYLQQNAFDKEDAYCPLKRQIPLFELINRIFDTPFNFSTHDEARQFFLSLQNHIKNMNTMPFQSDIYRKAFAKIEEDIQHMQK
jgi:V/A-type H+-transporting ATPase subunit A